MTSRMEYIYQNCFWDHEGLFTLPIMSTDAKSSCLMYASYDEPDIIRLGNLQVAPRVRKDGRGKDILRFCEDIARSKGFEKIQLKAQTDSWMMAWYEREGFVPYAKDTSQPDTYTWLEKTL